LIIDLINAERLHKNPFFVQMLRSLLSAPPQSAHFFPPQSSKTGSLYFIAEPPHSALRRRSKI